MRTNLEDVEKEGHRIVAKYEMKKLNMGKEKHGKEAFEEVQSLSMVDLSILSNKAHDIIKKDFESTIGEGSDCTLYLHQVEVKEKW